MSEDTPTILLDVTTLSEGGGFHSRTVRAPSARTYAEQIADGRAITDYVDDLYGKPGLKVGSGDDASYTLIVLAN